MSTELALANASARPGSRPAASRAEPGPARRRQRIHVLVADEPGMIRDALCVLVRAMPDIALVSGSANSVDALHVARSLRPDVIVLEFPKPPEFSSTLITALKRELPEVRIIVLTFRADDHLVDAATRAGADGYVLKKDSRDELASAIQEVIAGKTYRSPSVSSRRLRGPVRTADATKDRARDSAEITHRERQVIRMIAQGHRTREIAQLLSLSHKTVEKHRTSIMRKLGLRNASQVAAYAIANGIAES